jgi:hypothetical protein
MKLEVLHVPDCPNLAPMLQRLAEATDLPVPTRLIETDADAAEFGLAGSPTLLIDGVDPFAAADDCGCGVSCRLYRNRDGRIVPAPSVEQSRAAVMAADQTPPLPGLCGRPDVVGCGASPSKAPWSGTAPASSAPTPTGVWSASSTPSPNATSPATS